MSFLCQHIRARTRTHTVIMFVYIATNSLVECPPLSSHITVNTRQLVDHRSSGDWRRVIRTLNLCTFMNSSDVMRVVTLVIL